MYAKSGNFFKRTLKARVKEAHEYVWSSLLCYPLYNFILLKKLRFSFNLAFFFPQILALFHRWSSTLFSIFTVHFIMVPLKTSSKSVANCTSDWHFVTVTLLKGSTSRVFLVSMLMAMTQPFKQEKLFFARCHLKVRLVPVPVNQLC